MASNVVIGRLITDLVARVQGYNRGLDQAQKRTQTFAQRSAASLRTVNTALGVAMPLSAAAGAFAIQRFVRSGLRDLDRLDRAAAKLGTTMESLSRLEFAGAIAGVDDKTLEMAIQRMQRRIGEASVGTGEARPALKELGLDPDRLKRLDIEDQLLRIAKAFEQVEAPADRLRLAFKLFDSEGVALLRILNRGEKGIRDFFAESDRGGITFRGSTEDVEKFNESLARTDQFLKAVKRGAGGETASRLNNLGDVFGKIGVNAQILGESLVDFTIPKPRFALTDNPILNTFRRAKKAREFAEEAATRPAKPAAPSQNFFELERLAQEASRVIESIKTPQEQLDERMQELNRIMEAGLLTQQQFQRAAKQAQDEFARAADPALTELQSKAAQVIEATRTPVEKFKLEVEELQMLLSEGLINDTVFNRAVAQAEQLTQSIDPIFEASKSRAQALTEAVRTPAEVFKDELSEIDALLSKGLISRETAMRAAREARERVANAMEIAGGIETDLDIFDRGANNAERIADAMERARAAVSGRFGQTEAGLIPTAIPVPAAGRLGTSGFGDTGLDGPLNARAESFDAAASDTPSRDTSIQRVHDAQVAEQIAQLGQIMRDLKDLGALK